MFKFAVLSKHRNNVCVIKQNSYFLIYEKWYGQKPTFYKNVLEASTGIGVLKGDEELNKHFSCFKNSLVNDF